jgi:hypothetical protein
MEHERFTPHEKPGTEARRGPLDWIVAVLKVLDWSRGASHRARP